MSCLLLSINVAMIGTCYAVGSASCNCRSHPHATCSELKFWVKRTCPQNEILASPAKFLEPGAVLRTCTTQRIPVKCGKKIERKKTEKQKKTVKEVYLCNFSATEPLFSSRQTKCPSQTRPQLRLHRWKKTIGSLPSLSYPGSIPANGTVCLCQGESPSCIISIESNCLRPWLHAQYHSFELGSLITISCQAGSSSFQKNKGKIDLTKFQWNY